MNDLEGILRFIIAGLLILLFGYIIAEIVYWFIWIHYKAYLICKEWLNGKFYANA